MSGAGAGILLRPKFSWTKDDIDPTVASIVKNTIGIDTHKHIDVLLNKKNQPGPAADLSGEMKKSGLSAICMTFAIDYQKLTTEGEAYDRFNDGLDAMDQMLKANKMIRSLNLADLRAALENRQPTLVQSVEGAHFPEGHPNRIEKAYQRGLRHLGLLSLKNISTLPVYSKRKLCLSPVHIS